VTLGLTGAIAAAILLSRTGGPVRLSKSLEGTSGAGIADVDPNN